jgi:hypothetical protein
MIKIEKTNAESSLFVLRGIGRVLYDGSDHPANVFTEEEAQRIANALNREPPALEIDKRLYPNPGNPMSARARLERRIVWALINHIVGSGKFDLYRIFDGEQMTRVSQPKQAMEILFNLDEASLRFVRTDLREALTAACKQPKVNDVLQDDARRELITLAKRACDEHEHGVYLVFGNAGYDCISDWNYSADDADGFNALMEAFKPEEI